MVTRVQRCNEDGDEDDQENDDDDDDDDDDEEDVTITKKRRRQKMRITIIIVMLLSKVSLALLGEDHTRIGRMITMGGTATLDVDARIRDSAADLTE